MRCSVLLVLLCFHQAFGRILPVLVPSKLPRQDHHDFRQDIIGGWISSSEWFPIMINIPDTISGFTNGLANGFMNFSQAFASWIQGIPMFNKGESTASRIGSDDDVWFVPIRVRRRGHTPHPYAGVENNVLPIYP